MRVNGHSVLIPVDEKWNPLETIGAAPEYVPPSWDGPHCSVRLVQAFKTLASMPVANGPRFRSGSWPGAPMEWIDIVAKEHEWLNDPGQAREAAQQWARTRHRVTPAEVGRMEAAPSWPARYLVTRPWVLRLVQQVACSGPGALRPIGSPTSCTSRRLCCGVSTAPGSTLSPPGCGGTTWWCSEAAERWRHVQPGLHGMGAGVDRSTRDLRALLTLPSRPVTVSGGDWSPRERAGDLFRRRICDR
jgi:hypothetical protein